ncbi:hypothetical protein PS631_00381 [Pseudomonas fluorescens]|uniref:Uncharacterized protein n=1 Tax=Pseudomonas fluorescens TaxID=294 RepID=A0A5E6PN29_PSEFL|nr:hypothetical protein PS631_00381 [Pseudomonas fluorescens]
MPRLLSLLLLSLPLLCLAEPVQLRIQGSNTIGTALGPALVQGMLRSKGATAIEHSAGAVPNEIAITAQGRDGELLSVLIAAHGSSTGFAALGSGAQIWLRPRDRSVTSR